MSLPTMIDVAAHAPARADRHAEPTVVPSPADRIAPIKIILFPARLFLALGWIRAGVEKLISADWWNGTELQGFLAEYSPDMLPFLRPLSESVGTTTAVGLSAVVLLAELMIGFCLVTARGIGKALVAASLLNLAFVALGAVTPSAFYLVLQLTLLLALVAERPAPPLPWLVGAIVGCLGIAASSAPFVRTLHPHEVIEDPAMMLVTLSLLIAATAFVAAVDRRPHGSRGSDPAGESL